MLVFLSVEKIFLLLFFNPFAMTDFVENVHSTRERSFMAFRFFFGDFYYGRETNDKNRIQRKDVLDVTITRIARRYAVFYGERL